MDKKIEVAEFYSSKGVKPEQVLGGKWEQEKEHIVDYGQNKGVRVWKNKEVKAEDYHD